jgi:hypothetical protein
VTCAQHVASSQMAEIYAQQKNPCEIPEIFKQKTLSVKFNCSRSLQNVFRLVCLIPLAWMRFACSCCIEKNIFNRSFTHIHIRTKNDMDSVNIAKFPVKSSISIVLFPTGPGQDGYYKEACDQSIYISKISVWNYLNYISSNSIVEFSFPAKLLN